MKIIGLTGFAKSGKSTAAEILKSLGGQEVAFAKHLKDVCSVVFTIPRDHFDDQNIKESPFEIPILVHGSKVADILELFEIESRFVPQSILSHAGAYLTSPRHMAQYVGTEILRSIDKNIHIKMAFKLNQDSTAKFLICSDVRFDNELKAVKDNHGLMIGISRQKAIPTDLVNLHPSEKEIPDLISKSTFVATNESSIEEFQAKIQLRVSDYLQGK